MLLGASLVAVTCLSWLQASGHRLARYTPNIAEWHGGPPKLGFPWLPTAYLPKTIGQMLSKLRNLRIVKTWDNRYVHEHGEYASCGFNDYFLTMR